ncbi:hypothetical protein BKA66DRAFT_526799 [Pyrenochaeta sp. MPI-SDFR-AT-0127]|nr:hypothetical protein BKA66DRAFT_526799 [Pyrenochaeta sp. MPI-SDFR-AT-0127]
MYLLATLLSLAACVFASPAPQSEVAPAPAPANEGSITHLYLCNDASFQGACANLHLEISACHNVQDEYKKQASSAGPDEGTFCTLYTYSDCRGRALPFTFPGIRNLKRYGFDDALISVRCDFIAGWHSHP